MDPNIEPVRVKLRELMVRAGVTPRAFHKVADVHYNTLYKFLADTESKPNYRIFTYAKLVLEFLETAVSLKMLPTKLEGKEKYSLVYKMYAYWNSHNKGLKDYYVKTKT